MRIVTSIILLASVTKVFSKELVANGTIAVQETDSMVGDNLVDMLADKLVDKATDKLVFLLASRTKDSIDKLVDNLTDRFVGKMFNRALKTPSLQQANLDSSTLGKGGPPPVLASGAAVAARLPPPLSPAPSKLGESVGEAALTVTSRLGKNLVIRPKDVVKKDDAKVSTSIRRMQRDMAMLDVEAGTTPQLSTVELGLLAGAVGLSAVAPFSFSPKVVEVLVPSLGALTAAVGFSAEFMGKSAVARGKEIAATTLQAAAEAELYLAQAERAKAIIPLCVGISATAAAFALVAPAIIAQLEIQGLAASVIAETYLICPLFAGLSAAVSALAASEVASLSKNAMGVGARRFASSGDVGRTWLSATEQISSSTRRTKEKWTSFTLGVLPAPVLAFIAPGDLAFKAIIAAAIAAAQTAFSLAQAEYNLAAAVESVALKARAAALSDTYANQGARAGSVLPFTSALAGLCAATTVAVVEALPLVPSVVGESVLCTIFPALGALFAAAASIGKACAEIDAEAASASGTTLAESRQVDDPDRNPLTTTQELVRQTITNAKRNVQDQWEKLIRLLTTLSQMLTGTSGKSCSPSTA